MPVQPAKHLQDMNVRQRLGVLLAGALMILNCCGSAGKKKDSNGAGAKDSTSAIGIISFSDHEKYKSFKEIGLIPVKTASDRFGYRVAIQRSRSRAGKCKATLRLQLKRKTRFASDTYAWDRSTVGQLIFSFANREFLITSYDQAADGVTSLKMACEDLGVFGD